MVSRVVPGLSVTIARRYPTRALSRLDFPTLGPVVMDALLERVLELGARAARAGEFSERAFLNGSST